MTGREIAVELRGYAVVMADHDALRSAAVCRVAADRIERMDAELKRLRAQADQLKFKNAELLEENGRLTSALHGGCME